MFVVGAGEVAGLVLGVECGVDSRYRVFLEIGGIPLSCTVTGRGQVLAAGWLGFMLAGLAGVRLVSQSSSKYASASGSAPGVQPGRSVSDTGCSVAG